ncbi:MAG TPA: hypothetical protein VL404_08155 [Candidatus Eisenbacteria bacterium]|nr:hypothetical protein [Candidatus Eisenbacteria bacterium]
MALSEKDKAFIRENRSLSSRQLAKRLGVPRTEVEKHLQGPGTGVRASSAAGFSAVVLPAWAWAVLAALVLTAQNLYVFRNHYWGNLGVPGDFSSVNYAIPFFWITCLQERIFPHWVPFQAMGYPLQINMVSNLFYPPFWLFALAGRTYTMHAAISIQWMHVLFGAVGTYFLARRLGIAPLVSLAAAAAYQSFGGFYYTAQHDTIVRSYAAIPWLLSGLAFSSSLRWAAFAVPLAVLLLITGGYPGALMATFFMSAVYLAAQVFLSGEGTRADRLRAALVRGGLLALGVLLASVHLVPAWLQRQELARYSEFQSQDLFIYRWKDFFTFCLSAQTDSLYIVSGMRSLFVTVPVFGMLFFLRKNELRRHAPLAALAVVAALMVTGSLFYGMATAVLPPLKFSRFPCADYRVFLCLPVILLGAAAFSRASEDRPGVVEAAVRTAAFLAFFAVGWNLLPAPAEISREALVAAGLFAAFAALVAWRPLPAQALAAVFVAFIVFNGIQSHRHLSLWQVDDFYAKQEDEFRSSIDSSGEAYDFRRDMTGGAALRARLKEELPARPARRIPDKRTEYMPGAFNHAWRGYLTGVFMIGDYSSGMQLARQKKAFEDPFIQAFMAEPSRALVLPADAKLDDLDALKRAIASGASGPGVKMKRYSIDGVDYDVDLARPAILVENEMYFPGWSARAGGEKGALTIRPTAAGGLVRAWALPAGRYELRTKFRMPHFTLGIVLSLAALILWAATFVLTAASRRLFGKKS